MINIPLPPLSFAFAGPFLFFSILWREVTELRRLGILLACTYNHLKTKTCAYTSMNEKYNCINKVAVAANSSEQRSGSEFWTLGDYQENPQLPSPAGAAACCCRSSLLPPPSKPPASRRRRPAVGCPVVDRLRPSSSSRPGQPPPR